MNKLLEIALGIVTSIGGFLDVGAITTAAEAGSGFKFQLMWALVLGTVCVIFLVEMSGRLSRDCSTYWAIGSLTEATESRGMNLICLIPFILG